MPTPHPRPWHRGSLFHDGPRIPLCRERRAVWKARVELHRRAGRLTDGFAYVGHALLKRLGQDGRCDPSHATLADDSGESVRTVQRALQALRTCGLVGWIRRLVRDGWRAAQTSNGYLLTIGNAPPIPLARCDGQPGRETRRIDPSTVGQPVIDLSPGARHAALAALERVAAERQAAVQARLLARR